MSNVALADATLVVYAPSAPAIAVSKTESAKATAASNGVWARLASVWYWVRAALLRSLQEVVQILDVLFVIDVGQPLSVLEQAVRRRAVGLVVGIGRGPLAVVQGPSGVHRSIVRRVGGPDVGEIVRPRQILVAVEIRLLGARSKFAVAIRPPRAPRPASEPPSRPDQGSSSWLDTWPGHPTSSGISVNR